MDIWDVMGYVAWAGGAMLILWILVDAVSIGRQFDEDFLLSSREGEE